MKTIDLPAAARTAKQLGTIRRLLRSGQARLMRHEAGLSQAEVARLLGVSCATVSRWESGSRVPRAADALNYFELLRSLES